MPYAPRVLIVCSLILVAYGQLAGAQVSMTEDNSTRMNASLLVLGDTSQAPLDEASLNALFTPTFASQAMEKLQKALGDDAEFDLQPSSIGFRYVSEAEKAGNAHVAMITVGFIDPPEELQSKLQIEAPKAVLELLKQRVYDYLNFRHEMQHSELEKQREQLAELKMQLEKRLVSLQHQLLDSSTLVSTSDLRDHYSTLEHRRREERMQALGIAAEKEAIENQIEELRVGSQQGADSPLLAELEAAAAARQKMVDGLRARADASSGKVAELQKAVAQVKQAITAARNRGTGGDSEQRHQIQSLEAQLQNAKSQVAAATAEQAALIDQAEVAAMQGKIEYLRQKEELTRAQYGGRLEKLNEMLSQVAIQSDSLHARSEAMAKEMEQVARSIAERNSTDNHCRRLEREADLVENQLEHVQVQLFHIENSLQNIPKEEFAILPWGS